MMATLLISGIMGLSSIPLFAEIPWGTPQAETINMLKARGYTPYTIDGKLGCFSGDIGHFQVSIIAYWAETTGVQSIIVAFPQTSSGPDLDFAWVEHMIQEKYGAPNNLVKEPTWTAVWGSGFPGIFLTQQQGKTLLSYSGPRFEEMQAQILGSGLNDF